MPQNNPEPQLETTRHIAVRAVVSFMLIVIVLGGSLVLAVLLFITRDKPEEAADARLIPPVETLRVEIDDFPVEIITQGTVESRRETRIAAELSGRVIEVAPGFRRGGRVRAGEVIVKIESTDYQAALAEARSALAEAELALAQEVARAEQSSIDWQRLGSSRPATPLVLRVPQLAAAQAKTEAARAAVDRAGRDLDRTEIRAPFDAAVRDARAETGTITRAGEPIAELFTADDLEIRLPLTLEDYGFLDLAADGTVTATIQLTGTLGGREHHWPADPLKLDSEIDRTTLSAYLIARVRAREDGGAPALPPVGLFVNARISGITLENVAVIPRRAIREGVEVIVITPENRVEFRPIEIARSTRHDAIVRAGLTAGERICLTRLNAPVGGMEVVDTTEPSHTD